MDRIHATNQRLREGTLIPVEIPPNRSHWSVRKRKAHEHWLRARADTIGDEHRKKMNSKLPELNRHPNLIPDAHVPKSRSGSGSTPCPNPPSSIIIAQDEAEDRDVVPLTRKRSGSDVNLSPRNDPVRPWTDKGKGKGISSMPPPSTQSSKKIAFEPQRSSSQRSRSSSPRRSSSSRSEGGPSICIHGLFKG